MKFFDVREEYDGLPPVLLRIVLEFAGSLLNKRHRHARTCWGFPASRWKLSFYQLAKRNSAPLR